MEKETNKQEGEGDKGYSSLSSETINDHDILTSYLWTWRAACNKHAVREIQHTKWMLFVAKRLHVVPYRVVRAQSSFGRHFDSAW